MAGASAAPVAGAGEGYRRQCLVSADLAPFIDREELRRGLALRRIGIAVDAAEAAVALLSGSDGRDDGRLRKLAGCHGLPVLELDRGPRPDTLRLAEIASGVPAGGGRFGRWHSDRGARLTEDAVASAADIASTASWPGGAFPGMAVLPEPCSGERGACDEVAGRGAQDEPCRDQWRRAVAAEVIYNSFPPDRAPAAIAEAVLAVGNRRVPTVSVVICNHDYGEFLGDAIRSALCQTVRPLEVIVVDDGSTDGSDRIIEGAAGIIPVLKPNGGQASAMNAGFARARGEVVIFLDADDRLRCNAVARLSETDPRDYARLQYGLETLDRAGRPTGLYPGSGRMASGHLLGAVASRGIVPFMPTSGNAFPRWVLERLLPMPEEGWRICADLYLVLAAAALGPVASLDEVLGQYRIHGRNAYFRPLLSEPFLHSARLSRRLRAWREIVWRLPRLLPGAEGERAGLELHDLVLRTAILGGHASAGEVLRDAADAVAVAAAARSQPAARRLHHALRPVALAYRRLGRALSADLAAQPPRPTSALANPGEAAGPSAWPRLESGDEIDLAALGHGPDPLGRGWSRKDRTGAILTEASGSLAFLLPDLDVDWKLRLTYSVLSGEALLGAELLCGGAPIARADLLGDGEVELNLSRDLLRPGPNGGCGCCLTLRVRNADIGRVRLLRLRADLSYGHSPRAPLLSDGAMEPVVPGSPAEAALVSGWAWPDGDGALIEGRRARLDLSLLPGHRNTLTLALAQGVGSVAVAVNGVLASAHLALDLRSLTIDVPPHDIPASGRASLELMAFPDAESRAWPTIRLSGVRRDTLSSEPGALAWNLPCAGAMLATTRGASALLVPEGRDARLVTNRLCLPLALPALTEPALLLASFVLLGPVDAPPDGSLTVAGRSVGLCLGRENVVRIGLPAGAPRSIVLEGTFDTVRGAVALRSLSLALGKAPARPAGPVPRTGATGRDLLALAADEGAWHLTDEALWLAGDVADLLLPPMPGALALDVTVLTISHPVQRLALQVGDHRVQGVGPGRQTLRLRLPPSFAAQGGPFRVVTDRLIAAEALGLADPGMLGGAIAGIVPVFDDSSAPLSSVRIEEPAS